MPKKEYIERDYVLRSLVSMDYPWTSVDDTYKVVQDAPAADVAPVVHGRWIFEHDPINDPKKYFIRIVCSCCGLKTGQVSNFCPCCGAKMDGERKEQT